jgi:hypothetical protein
MPKNAYKKPALQRNKLKDRGVSNWGKRKGGVVNKPKPKPKKWKKS